MILPYVFSNVIWLISRIVSNKCLHHVTAKTLNNQAIGKDFILEIKSPERKSFRPNEIVRKSENAKEEIWVEDRVILPGGGVT